MLRVKTRKTGAVVMLPLHIDFAEWLREQTRGNWKRVDIPEPPRQNGGGKSGLSMKFRAIMERADE